MDKMANMTLEEVEELYSTTIKTANSLAKIIKRLKDEEFIETHKKYEGKYFKITEEVWSHYRKHMTMRLPYVYLHVQKIRSADAEENIISQFGYTRQGHLVIKEFDPRDFNWGYSDNWPNRLFTEEVSQEEYVENLERVLAHLGRPKRSIFGTNIKE